jgi:hypothetical protein
MIGSPAYLWSVVILVDGGAVKADHGSFRSDAAGCF